VNKNPAGFLQESKPFFPLLKQVPTNNPQMNCFDSNLTRPYSTIINNLYLFRNPSGDSTVILILSNSPKRL